MAHIIVGVDGSDAAKGALRWAIDFAKDGDRIEIVHSWNLYALGSFEAPHVNPSDFEVAAMRLVRNMSDEVVTGPEREQFDFVYTARHGHAAEVLIGLSDHADLLVVGSHDHGGIHQIVLGSVSSDVVHHAICPVVVVPPAGSRRAVSEGEPAKRPWSPRPMIQ